MSTATLAPAATADLRPLCPTGCPTAAVAVEQEQAPALRAVARHDGPLMRVVLHGELDIATGPVAEAVFEGCAGRSEETSVDASGLRFIDASGVRALLRAQELCERRGGRLTVAAASTQVLLVLRICGLTDRLLAPARRRPDGGAGIPARSRG
ncbi:STAS domain-containing protein [Kitasatospora sp. NPDC059571]|uniref:STAS domain-containing protein n=1 Tax=Kitasatospora sp. NPDC059571 TaxID=3346871 RepID=UPI0036A2A777